MSVFQRSFNLFVTVCLLLLGATKAQARVALIVGEPFGRFGWMMPQGHAGIYIPDACVDTPVHLRPCRPGEFGAVISRYHDLRHPALDWMAFPLPVFLYGTSEPTGNPPFMTAAKEAELRERYREEHLATLVPELPDHHGHLRPPPYGDWEEGIGSAYDRRLFVYQFDTTPTQDAAMLSWLNDRPNRRSYTLTRANCADFVADLLRLALPPSLLRRNVLADFDMTTPKTLSRELDSYGAAHPELHMTVYDVPQLPGSLPRSRPIRGAAQSLLTNRLYLSTLLVLQPEIILADLIIYEKRGKWTLGADAQVIAPVDWEPATVETTDATDFAPLASPAGSATGVARAHSPAP